MHTKQTAFSKMWQFYIIQDNPPCIIGDGAYYRYKRTRCIIGCCMSVDDTKAIPGTERIEELMISHRRIIEKNFAIKDMDFYIEAQAYHDQFDWSVNKNWKRYIQQKLTELANKYSLEIPAIAF